MFSAASGGGSAQKCPALPTPPAVARVRTSTILRSAVVASVLAIVWPKDGPRLSVITGRSVGEVNAPHPGTRTKENSSASLFHRRLIASLHRAGVSVNSEAKGGHGVVPDERRVQLARPRDGAMTCPRRVYSALMRMLRNATRPVCAWRPTKDGAPAVLGRPRFGSVFRNWVTCRPLRTTV